MGRHPNTLAAIVAFGGLWLGVVEPSAGAAESLATGVYVGTRGYDTARGADCLAEYPPFVVFVRDGSLSFDSDGRHWQGTMDAAGDILIKRDDIAPKPKTDFTVKGPLDSAAIQSGFCGKGWLKLDPASGEAARALQFTSESKEDWGDGLTIATNDRRCFRLAGGGTTLPITGEVGKGKSWTENLPVNSLTAYFRALNTDEEVDSKQVMDVTFGFTRKKKPLTTNGATGACFVDGAAAAGNDDGSKTAPADPSASKLPDAGAAVPQATALQPGASGWCLLECDSGGWRFKMTDANGLEVGVDVLVLEGCDGELSVNQKPEVAFQLREAPLSVCGQ